MLITAKKIVTGDGKTVIDDGAVCVDECGKIRKVGSASELKYMGELKAVLAKEFSNPSPEFVKYISKQVYDGVMTAKLLE